MHAEGINYFDLKMGERFIMDNNLTGLVDWLKIDSNRATINDRRMHHDSRTYSLLQIALICGSIDIVTALLENGADANLKSTRDSYFMPMAIVAREYGLNPSYKDRWLKLTSILIQYGADPNVPVHFCVFKHNEWPRVDDKKWQSIICTPLSAACILNDDDYADKLLTANYRNGISADPNLFYDVETTIGIWDILSRTPMDIIRENETKLEHWNMNANAVDRWMLSASSFGFSLKSRNLERMLLKHGARESKWKTHVEQSKYVRDVKNSLCCGMHGRLGCNSPLRMLDVHIMLMISNMFAREYETHAVIDGHSNGSMMLHS